MHGIATMSRLSATWFLYRTAPSWDVEEEVWGPDDQDVGNPIPHHAVKKPRLPLRNPSSSTAMPPNQIYGGLSPPRKGGAGRPRPPMDLYRLESGDIRAAQALSGLRTMGRFDRRLDMHDDEPQPRPVQSPRGTAAAHHGGGGTRGNLSPMRGNLSQWYGGHRPVEDRGISPPGAGFGPPQPAISGNRPRQARDSHGRFMSNKAGGGGGGSRRSRSAGGGAAREGEKGRGESRGTASTRKVRDTAWTGGARHGGGGDMDVDDDEGAPHVVRRQRGGRYQMPPPWRGETQMPGQQRWRGAPGGYGGRGAVGDMTPEREEGGGGYGGVATSRYEDDIYDQDRGGAYDEYWRERPAPYYPSAASRRWSGRMGVGPELHRQGSTASHQPAGGRPRVAADTVAGAALQRDGSLGLVRGSMPGGNQLQAAGDRWSMPGDVAPPLTPFYQQARMVQPGAARMGSITSMDGFRRGSGDQHDVDMTHVGVGGGADDVTQTVLSQLLPLLSPEQQQQLMQQPGAMLVAAAAAVAAGVPGAQDLLTNALAAAQQPTPQLTDHLSPDAAADNNMQTPENMAALLQSLQPSLLQAQQQHLPAGRADSRSGLAAAPRQPSASGDVSAYGSPGPARHHALNGEASQEAAGLHLTGKGVRPGMGLKGPIPPFAANNNNVNASRHTRPGTGADLGPTLSAMVQSLKRPNAISGPVSPDRPPPTSAAAAAAAGLSPDLVRGLMGSVGPRNMVGEGSDLGLATSSIKDTNKLLEALTAALASVATNQNHAAADVGQTGDAVKQSVTGESLQLKQADTAEATGGQMKGGNNLPYRQQPAKHEARPDPEAVAGVNHRTPQQLKAQGMTMPQPFGDLTVRRANSSRPQKVLHQQQQQQQHFHLHQASQLQPETPAAIQHGRAHQSPKPTESNSIPSLAPDTSLEPAACALEPLVLLLDQELDLNRFEEILHDKLNQIQPVLFQLAKSAVEESGGSATAPQLVLAPIVLPYPVQVDSNGDIVASQSGIHHVIHGIARGSVEGLANTARNLKQHAASVAGADVSSPAGEGAGGKASSKDTRNTPPVIGEDGDNALLDEHNVNEEGTFPGGQAGTVAGTHEQVRTPTAAAMPVTTATFVTDPHTPKTPTEMTNKVMTDKNTAQANDGDIPTLYNGSKQDNAASGMDVDRQQPKASGRQQVAAGLDLPGGDRALPMTIMSAATVEQLMRNQREGKQQQEQQQQAAMPQGSAPAPATNGAGGGGNELRAVGMSRPLSPLYGQEGGQQPPEDLATQQLMRMLQSLQNMHGKT